MNAWTCGRCTSFNQSNGLRCLGCGALAIDPYVPFLSDRELHLLAIHDLLEPL